MPADMDVSAPFVIGFLGSSCCKCVKTGVVAKSLMAQPALSDVSNRDN